MSDEDRTMLSQMMKMLFDLNQKIEAHMIAEDARLDKMDEHIESIDGVVQAFPHTQDGIPDFQGHRSDHDKRITDGKSWSRMIQTMKNKAAELVVTGVFALILLGFMAWIDQRHTDSDARMAIAQKQINGVMESINKTVLLNQEALKTK